MNKRFMMSSFLILSAMTVAACADPEPENAVTGTNEQGDEETPVTTEETENSVSLAWNSQPPTLDPHVTNTNVVRDLARPVFEQLVTFDESYEPIPMLADSFEENEDGSEITFYLREGVLFHNDEEMTADDVVASMEKWQSGGAPAAAMGDSTWQEVDEYTVKLHVDEPSISVMYTLADVTQAAAIMPKEIIDSAGSTGVEQYIGTGPFQLEDWVYDSYIQFSKFDDYQSLDGEPNGLGGKKEALVDDLFVYFVADDSTRTNGIITGEYDYAFQLPQDSYDQLEGADGIVNDVWPFGFQTLVFNKEGIFGDQSLRSAVNYGLNNEDLLALAFTDETFYEMEPAYMRPEQTSWYTQAGEEHYDVYDLEQAEQLLDEAGYSGEEITILTSEDYSYHYNSAIITQQALEDFGMNATLDATDWATLLERRDQKEGWDIFFTQFTTVATPLSYPFLHSENEYAGWTNNEEIDRHLNGIRYADSQDEATELFEDLQQIIWEDLPVVNVGMVNFISSYSDDIDGYSEFMGPIFWNMSIEE